MPLNLGGPDAQLEAEMRHLAAAAVASIDRRVGVGEDSRRVVADVIGRVFGGVSSAATIDRIIRQVRALRR